MSANQGEVATEERGSDVPPRTPHHPLQFSLFSMFVVTTAVAAVCSMVFSMDAIAAYPLLVLCSVALAATSITVIVYGRGFQRTFCIGAVVPFGVLLLTLGFSGVFYFLDGANPRTDTLSCRLVFVGFWASSILVGVICVGVRRLIEKRQT